MSYDMMASWKDILHPLKNRYLLPEGLLKRYFQVYSNFWCVYGGVVFFSAFPNCWKLRGDIAPISTLGLVVSFILSNGTYALLCFIKGTKCTTQQIFFVFSGMNFCNSCGWYCWLFGVIFKTLRKLQSCISCTLTAIPYLPRYYIE